MAAIDNADVKEYKNEADHSRKEETNFTFYDNREINIKSELDDTPIDYNVNEDGSLKDTFENFNNIRIKKESVENVSYIEISVESVKNENDNSEINIKNELDDTPVDYNVNEGGSLKETVENDKIIRIKNESFENVNTIEIPEENYKNDNYIEITEKAVKNLSNIEILYNIPVDYEDELHSEMPEGSPHCKRSALRFASQEATDDHKKWSAKRADERTAQIISRRTQPVAVSGVQFAKSPRAELWKYNAPPEYAGVFDAPFKKPKADSLKVKNSSKTSNESVYSDVNIPELSKRTKHMKEAKEKANCTETCKDKFICDECGQLFHKKYYIILHMKRKHLKDLEKQSKLNCEKIKYVLGPYTCTKCGMKFIRQHDFIKHMRTHGEKPYSCTMCQKQFSESSNLNRHMRTHTGEKPYSCTVCKKQFSGNNNFNRHMRTHTGEKPYLCTVCNKQFGKSCHLNRHIKTHTGEKPYACTLCDKQFNQSNILNIHMRKHTDEKPYSCKVCMKSFRDGGTLNRHMRTHTGEKRYLCTVCKKQFSQNCHLNTHMRTHTGEKLFSCSVCNKQFSDNSNWRRHSKKCQ